MGLASGGPLYDYYNGKINGAYCEEILGGLARARRETGGRGEPPEPPWNMGVWRARVKETEVGRSCSRWLMARTTRLSCLLNDRQYAPETLGRC